MGDIVVLTPNTIQIPASLSVEHVSGHGELRERTGVMVEELKCGWPSVFGMFQKIKCFLSLKHRSHT